MHLCLSDSKLHLHPPPQYHVVPLKPCFLRRIRAPNLSGSQIPLPSTAGLCSSYGGGFMLGNLHAVIHLLPSSEVRVRSSDYGSPPPPPLGGCHVSLGASSHTSPLLQHSSECGLPTHDSSLAWGRLFIKGLAGKRQTKITQRSIKVRN